jgi:hypothetical protein
MDWKDRSRPKSTPDESPRTEPRGYARRDETQSVRLIRKYADMIDGVNLEAAEVGDRLELPRQDAEILIAEGWAERARDERRVRLLPGRALAADTSRPRKPKG